MNQKKIADRQYAEETMAWIELYAIWDRKGEQFDTPFFAHSQLFAKRRFELMAQDDNSPLQMWPGDFELFKVGRFNIKTHTLIEECEFVMDAKQLRVNAIKEEE